MSQPNKNARIKSGKLIIINVILRTHTHARYLHEVITGYCGVYRAVCTHSGRCTLHAQTAHALWNTIQFINTRF